MYLLKKQEIVILRSQIMTSNWGGRRHPPRAFTEQGVAMLSSVLKSKRAIDVNIAIMRAFVKFKEFLSAHNALALKLGELERKVGAHDENIRKIFFAIRKMLTPPPPPGNPSAFAGNKRRTDPSSLKIQRGGKARSGSVRKVKGNRLKTGTPSSYADTLSAHIFTDGA